jgi:hypothetical protein
VTGYLDEATETWTDLDDMLAAELPPCEVRVRLGFPGARAAMLAMPDPEPCGAPAVSVVTYTCVAACRPPWRRSTCEPHLSDMRMTPPGSARCGFCGAEVRIGGLS